MYFDIIQNMRDCCHFTARTPNYKTVQFRQLSAINIAKINSYKKWVKTTWTICMKFIVMQMWFENHFRYFKCGL